MNFFLILFTFLLSTSLYAIQYCPNSPYEADSMKAVKHWNNCNGIYLNSSNGNKYEGEFRNGKPNGIGKFYSLSGVTYEGSWKNGKFFDKGTLIWSDGSKYKGYWKNGQRHGNGSFFSTSGNIYEGEWKNDLFDGQGTLIYSGGSRYEGQWKKGLKSGKGTHNWANGTIYKGSFKLGKYSGKGIITFTDGEYYKGEWKNGLRNGKGSNFWPDGRQYKGEWKNDKKNGKGKFHFSNGDSYEGNWINDLYDGYGSYKWTDGRKFTGNFKNGNKNGQGTQFSILGDKYEGNWKNDKLIDKLNFNILRIYYDSKDRCSILIDISNDTSLTINSIKYKIALINEKNQLLDQQVNVTKKISPNNTVFSNISFENKFPNLCENIKLINFIGFSDLNINNKGISVKFYNNIISTVIKLETKLNKECSDYKNNSIAYECYKKLPSSKKILNLKNIKFVK